MLGLLIMVTNPDHSPLRSCTSHRWPRASGCDGWRGWVEFPPNVCYPPKEAPHKLTSHFSRMGYGWFGICARILFHSVCSIQPRALPECLPPPCSIGASYISHSVLIQVQRRGQHRLYGPCQIVKIKSNYHFGHDAAASRSSECKWSQQWMVLLWNECPVDVTACSGLMVIRSPVSVQKSQWCNSPMR